MTTTANTTTAAPEALFDIKEAARRQGCSVRLMSKHLTEKKITCIRVGGLIRFKQSFLDAYNESRTCRAAGWKNAR